jgi:hypothetical protein
MQCEAFERRLQQLLDERQRPEFDRNLLRHAEQCSECAEILAVQELLFASLQEDTPEGLDDNFAERVVQRSLSSPASGASAGIKLLITGAIAALLLLMFVPTWLPRRIQGTEGDRLQALLPPTFSGEGLPTEPSVSLPSGPALAAPPSTAVGTLQIDTLAHALYIDSFGTLLLELPDGTLAPVDQLTGGLRPLASSFSVAFDALRRSFPLGWESRHEKRRAATTVASGEFA